MLRHRSSTIALALLLAASAAAAQTGSKRPVPDEYAGTTTNLTPGSENTLSIQVLHWSSESDRKQVLSVIRNASADVSAAVDAPEDVTKQLEGVQTAGYIWTDGGLGYSLKYAHRVKLPDGGARVTLVTDRPLGRWDRSGPWKAQGQEEEADPFTIVELHLEEDGKGEGKMSLGTPFTIDDADQTVGLSDYENATVMLKDVTRQPKPYWAPEP